MKNWPDKDLIYECDGEFGKGELYFSWYTHPVYCDDIVKNPKPEPWYEVLINIKGCGIDFQIKGHPKDKEEGVKLIKALTTGRFKNLKIHPYLGLLTYNLEYWEHQK